MGLDIGVSIQVLFELVPQQEAFAADFTHFVLGPVFVLAFLVSRDPLDRGGPELAEVAGEWFLSSVAPLVDTEDTASGEHLAAETTRVLFLQGCVLLLPVVGQQGLGGEGLGTVVTQVRQVGEVLVLGVVVGPYLRET